MVIDFNKDRRKSQKWPQQTTLEELFENTFSVSCSHNSTRSHFHDSRNYADTAKVHHFLSLCEIEWTRWHTIYSNYLPNPKQDNYSKTDKYAKED